MDLSILQSNPSEDSNYNTNKLLIKSVSHLGK